MTIVIIIHACAGVLSLCSGGAMAAADSETIAITEYELKAAFLINFIKFIHWPDDRVCTTGKELIICIAGEDPFGESIYKARGKTIRGRPLVIENAVDHAGITACHLLFIPATEKDRMPNLVKAVEGHPVLTVSEMEDFALHGGMINFIIVDNKIRFEINPDAAARAGIEISAQLLKLARIVRDR